MLDIVRAFERCDGVQVPCVVAPRRAGDPATVYSKVEKAERMLHWKARARSRDVPGRVALADKEPERVQAVDKGSQNSLFNRN